MNEYNDPRVLQYLHGENLLCLVYTAVHQCISTRDDDKKYKINLPNIDFSDHLNKLNSVWKSALGHKEP